MSLMTKTDLQRRSSDYRYDLIDLPDGMQARIRNMRESDYAEFIDSFSNKVGTPIPWRVRNFRSLLIAFCWVDDDAAPVMTEDDVKSEWWKKQDSLLVGTFFCRCRDWVGFDDNDVEAIENAAKNFDAVPADSCSDESPQD